MGLWGWRMAGVGLLLLSMGVAYSHPRWRWKGKPLASLLTVTVGQGVAPFFMGAMAVPAATAREVWPMALVPALVITGIYPLTQVYQIGEDRRRGDHTFAVEYGPERVFALARGLVGAGMGLMGGVLVWGEGFSRYWVWALPPGYAAFWWAIRAWGQRFALQTPYQNHDWALGISAGAAALFWIFLLVELLCP